MKQLRRIAWACVFILFAARSGADMVWPALIVEGRFFDYWWIIVFGLIIEVFFVRRLFSLAARKAIIATTVANLISCVAGLILVPLSGVLWELIFSWPQSFLDWGTFNPVTWTATFCLAVLFTTAIEALVSK